jgi:hypothetical protein
MLKSALDALTHLALAKPVQAMSIAVMSAKTQLQSTIVLAGTSAARQIKNKR